MAPSPRTPDCAVSVRNSAIGQVFKQLQKEKIVLRSALSLFGDEAAFEIFRGIDGAQLKALQ